ncbi:porin [Aliidiomarina minuta]|uniref:Porin n=1 Tax=Aliidiomarina minuta TaxID=880057 RepID=A0A432W4F1_9GAMM|nr:porin [Aliidiomarina minuta]RUO24382.1 porin [Aliidiomarina minuta]
MKKTLRIMLAIVLIASCFPLNAADIQIYGRAHLSLDRLGDGENTGNNVSSNLSRLGFRATTQINHDLEAFVQLEQLIRYGQRGSEFASRDSFAGVRGNFGSVRVGYFEPPGTVLRATVDLFNSRLGDSRNIGSGNDMAFDVRFRNGIHYQSPRVNGFTFDLQYTPHDDVGATTTNDQEGLGAGVNYQTGQFFIGLAYQSYETEFNRPEAWRLGTTYWLTEHWMLTGFLQHASDLVGGDRSVAGAGALYRFGDYSARGQVYQSSANDIDETGARMLVLGLDKKMAPTFTLYASYGVTDNEEEANFSVSAGGRDTGLTPLRGHSATGLSVGMIYDF